MVHPETHESVSDGQQGLILAAGPNIFAGYVGRDSTDVFMTIDNQRYYITGDLGILDGTGSLILTGRLKRFVKIGGEMISLPAMESVIHNNLSDDNARRHVRVDLRRGSGRATGHLSVHID